MNKVRLAIVGCGDIAQYIARFGRISRRLRLAAACDVDRLRAERFARRFSIPRVFTEYAAILASDVDAVYLATPHHLHFEMLKAAVAAGKAVFVEKPVTRTHAEGLEAACLAEQTGMKIAVNYQYRYDRGCHALARAVQQGRLGEIYSVRINVPWRRERAYFSRSPWHQETATAGGGTLLTQGSHLLDVALWAMNADSCSAMGYTGRLKFKDVEVEDLAHGIIEMSNGALVQISSSMVAAGEQAVTLEVYGERATAVYTDRPLPRVRFIGNRVRQEKPPIRGLHALQRSLEAFAAWVQGGEAHLVPVRESLAALAVVEAVYESARTGHKAMVRR